MLIGEDKEIVQAQHPSTALLLQVSISPLLPQGSEMNYPISGQMEGFVRQNFFCFSFWGKRGWVVAGLVCSGFFFVSISNEEKERRGGE